MILSWNKERTLSALHTSACINLYAWVKMLVDVFHKVRSFVTLISCVLTVPHYIVCTTDKGEWQKRKGKKKFSSPFLRVLLCLFLSLFMPSFTFYCSNIAPFTIFSTFSLFFITFCFDKAFSFLLFACLFTFIFLKLFLMLAFCSLKRLVFLFYGVFTGFFCVLHLSSVVFVRFTWCKNQRNKETNSVLWCCENYSKEKKKRIAELLCVIHLVEYKVDEWIISVEENFPAVCRRLATYTYVVLCGDTLAGKFFHSLSESWLGRCGVVLVLSISLFVYIHCYSGSGFSLWRRIWFS